MLLIIKSPINSTSSAVFTEEYCVIFINLNMLSSTGSTCLYLLCLVFYYVKLSLLSNNMSYPEIKKSALCFVLLLLIHKLLLNYYNYVYDFVAFTDAILNVTLLIVLFIICCCFIIVTELLVFNTIESTIFING